MLQKYKIKKQVSILLITIPECIDKVTKPV